MLAHYRPLWKIIGIEIQPHLVQLARQNLRSAKVEAKFLKADLREFNTYQSFDIIVSNPPYIPPNKGRISPDRVRAIARHEIKCSLPDVLKNIQKNLDKKGKAFLIYPSFRLLEIEKMCKNVDLQIAKKKLLHNNKRVIITLKWN
jgi:tRNA1(Val) A37 N6-methylase TrmN6